jgi:glutaredoxin
MPERHTIKCWGLSTCGHCRQTKQWLDSQGLDYDFIAVDLLEGEPRQAALKDVRSVNPHCSFPTILIDNETVVVGFREEKLKEALGL